jgi:hypothetical protein
VPGGRIVECGVSSRRSYTRAMHGMASLAVAETLARELLEPLGNRWMHTQADTPVRTS